MWKEIKERNWCGQVEWPLEFSLLTLLAVSWKPVKGRMRVILRLIRGITYCTTTTHTESTKLKLTFQFMPAFLLIRKLVIFTRC